MKIETVSYATSTSGTIAGLVFNEWLALGGFCIMLATFGVNTYFRLQERKDKNKLEELRRKFPEIDI